MIDQEVLNCLLDAINGIDGGCSTCIRAFVTVANIDLALAKCSYRFTMDVEGDEMVRIDKVDEASNA